MWFTIPLTRETIKKFRSYDGLVMYGFRHERVDKSIRFANGKDFGVMQKRDFLSFTQ